MASTGQPTNSMYKYFMPQSVETLVEFEKLSKKGKQKVLAMLTKAQNAPIRRGPYPYNDSRHGEPAKWVQIYFGDKRGGPIFKRVGRIQLHVEFVNFSSLQPIATVAANFYNCFFDAEKQVMARQDTSFKTVMLKSAEAATIILAEHLNWILYDEFIAAKTAEFRLQDAADCLSIMPQKSTVQRSITTETRAPSQPRRSSRLERKSSLKAQKAAVPPRPNPKKRKAQSKTARPNKKKTHNGPNIRLDEEMRSPDKLDPRQTTRKRVAKRLNFGDDSFDVVEGSQHRRFRALSAKLLVQESRLAAPSYWRAQRKLGKHSKLAKLVMRNLDEEMFQKMALNLLLELPKGKQVEIAGKYREKALANVKQNRKKCLQYFQDCEAEAEADVKEAVVFDDTADDVGPAEVDDEGPAEVDDVGPAQKGPAEVVTAEVLSANNVGPQLKTVDLQLQPVKVEKLPAVPTPDLIDLVDSPVKQTPEVFVHQPHYIMSSRTKSNYAGVTFEAQRPKPWRVKFKGSTKGRFATKAEACEAYAQLKNQSQPIKKDWVDDISYD